MQAKNAFQLWKDKLNEQQYTAVVSESPYTLVLAGAGSGKTSVLIARLLYLFLEKQQGPAQVLALTFTNKAAGEMRHRLASAFEWANSVWMGTFHSIAHRLLRRHSKEAHLPDGFTVIDSEDQQRLCRRILKDHEIDDKVLSGKTLAHLISREKDAGRRPADTLAHYGQLPWLKFYEFYEQNCQQSGLVDFGELLLRSYELLANNPNILNHYQGRFRHILVDEFQDTNRLQYQWVKLLAGESANVFVVGDDDQSIYGWRGAEIANIQDFTETMIPCQVVRLEQNYRSTQNILTASNAVIAQNKDRMGKALWSAQGDGKLIDYYRAINDYDEARWVLSHIQQNQRAGNALNECAILYRANHQSRTFEQLLTQAGIAYRVTGGMRFFERAEIKDALAYARLLANPQDDAAFDRVINLPSRGLGAKSLEKIRLFAQQNHLSQVQTLKHLSQHQGLTGKALAGAQNFLSLFPHWQGLRSQGLDVLMKAIIHEAGLWAFYGQEGITGEGRQENLEELITSAQGYVENEVGISEDEMPTNQDPLLNFLAQTALDSGDSQKDERDSVQLMTIHSAKGLEFNRVFLTGLEEGLFPSSRSMDSKAEIEEERRLMYVAMTRAKQQLHLSSCLMRRIHGTEQMMTESRFIEEVPASLLTRNTSINTSKSPHSTHTSMAFQQSAKQTTKQHELIDHPFPPKTRVLHPKFGEGVVTAIDGMGADGRVQVRFSDTSRWLMLSLARLSRCNQ